MLRSIIYLMDVRQNVPHGYLPRSKRSTGAGMPNVKTCVNIHHLVSEEILAVVRGVAFDPSNQECPLRGIERTAGTKPRLVTYCSRNNTECDCRLIAPASDRSSRWHEERVYGHQRGGHGNHGPRSDLVISNETLRRVPDLKACSLYSIMLFY